MIFWCLSLSALFLPFISVQGKPSSPQGDHTSKDADEYYDYVGDDYGEYGEEYNADNNVQEKEIRYNPKLLTKPKSLFFDKGTTIRLPCFVDIMTEDFDIIWTKVSSEKGEKHIAMGKSVMSEPNRISVEVNYDGEDKGSTLVIGIAEDKDAGQYKCQVAAGNYEEIKHTVSITEPPAIKKTPSNGLYLAHKGDSIHLTCQGIGTPEPKIVWTRLNKKLPDGRSSFEANELVFHDVTRQHSGTYQCSGDNGFSTPAVETIEVAVEYAPEIEVEEIFIHAKTGKEVELICNIHSHPIAIVKWFKNKVELTEDKNKLKRNGHKHTLTITNVTENDFGNYTCRAENQHGSEFKNLEVSGNVGFAEFNSHPKGSEPNSYLIEWTSESYSELTKFELHVRERGESGWHTYTVLPIRQGSFYYAGKNNLKGLKAATQYEASVAGENEYGWSRHGPLFHFATFGAVPLSIASTGSGSIFSLHWVLLKRHCFLSEPILAARTTP
ncbi:unnamed protein product [Lepeophtheirus salmonis]|uniref:(salmon louse) hypothetical protein n=1 Tax=Lepeophtheirus salmonis TaxID=72036 RepID=A0A7R8HAL2_LEPSM|nr:unnamed protein product [Lepeophtheirus salmonis]CAF2958202.1 unnamed protein product [Lepeophtheirus salmonis]